MNITEVKFFDHKVLGNLHLNFEKFKEPNTKDISNTIILAGVNGTGKTTIFNEIYKTIVNEKNKELENTMGFTHLKYKIESEVRPNAGSTISISDIFCTLLLGFNVSDRNTETGIYSFLPENKPRIIYVTAEVDFPEIKNKNVETIFAYNFYQKINANTVKNIPTYVSNQIMQSAYKEENLSLKEIRDKVFKEINDIFDILELDIKMVGMSDSNNLPLFEKNGVTFDINKLSSGEKQLFLRILSIKMLKVNNSIILIDEPEISLHPIWQQKILKVYEKIGRNNQIIIATHSPFILGSTKSENIRLLYRENGEIKVKNGNEMEEIYGKPVQRVLEDLMGLTSVRDPEINNQLEKLRNLVKENKFNTSEFKDLRKKMGEILGFDSDLMLIDMEVKKRENLKGKNL